MFYDLFCFFLWAEFDQRRARLYPSGMAGLHIEHVTALNHIFRAVRKLRRVLAPLAEKRS